MDVEMSRIIDSRVDINNCSETNLLSIKGIGKAFADRIVRQRRYRRFSSAEDLIKRVKGMGTRRWERIYDENEITFIFDSIATETTSCPDTVTRADKRYRKATYVKKRRGVIGMSGPQYDAIHAAALKAGVGHSQTRNIKILWRLYSIPQILARLDNVFPEHGFNLRDHKIPMLIIWLKKQPMKNNKEALRLKEQYSRQSLYKCPPLKDPFFWLR